MRLCRAPDCSRKVKREGLCTKHVYEKLGKPVPQYYSRYGRIPRAVRAFREAAEKDRKLFQAKIELSRNDEIYEPAEDEEEMPGCGFHTKFSSCHKYRCKGASQ